MGPSIIPTPKGQVTCNTVLKPLSSDDQLCDQPMNLFFRQMPTELILSIADFLPPETIVLLSLTSKHLYKLLFVRITAAIISGPSRLSFAFALQRDFPDLLACRACGHLYKWNIGPRGYRCPKAHRTWLIIHDPLRCSSLFVCEQKEHAFFQIPCRHDYYRMERVEVDLKLRTALIGPTAGLQGGFMDRESSYYSSDWLDAVRTELRYRIVDQELLFAATYSTTISVLEQVDFDNSAGAQIFEVRASTCRHVCDKIWSLTFKALQSQRRNKYSESIELDTVKCKVCASEYRLNFMPNGVENARLELLAWYNLGGLFPDRPDVANTWNPSLLVPVPSSDVISRNLEHRYNAHIEALHK